jgi:hypothetical protein
MALQRGRSSAAPGRSSTKATISSLPSLSRQPTTAERWMLGCVLSAVSTSAG